MRLTVALLAALTFMPREAPARVGGQAAGEGTGGVCVPASQRAGREFGCFILATQPAGQFGRFPVFWHLNTYATTADANKAKGPRDIVIESQGKVWLFSVGPAGWRPAGGVHVAEIGPLPVDGGVDYTAQYMEAVFKPGMRSVVHRHAGPEAFYTLTGETCLETPEGMQIGRAGGPPVMIPAGPPMELTSTGTVIRRGVVLILHHSAHPAISREVDWKPKGLCANR